MSTSKTGQKGIKTCILYEMQCLRKQNQKKPSSSKFKQWAMLYVHFWTLCNFGKTDATEMENCIDTAVDHCREFLTMAGLTLTYQNLQMYDHLL